MGLFRRGAISNQIAGDFQSIISLYVLLNRFSPIMGGSGEEVVGGDFKGKPGGGRRMWGTNTQMRKRTRMGGQMEMGDILGGGCPKDFSREENKRQVGVSPSGRDQLPSWIG